ncbi:hypothetical protein ACVWVY_001571 [Bradyrhizobium sp. URHC0002]
MASRDLRGAAYHEAGHAVVASVLGLRVGRIEIGIGGDEAKGSADIEHDPDLPLTEALAVCAAGLEAQKLFKAPTHPGAGWGDYGMMIELLDGFEEAASIALRDAGHQRAYELLITHSDQVEKIARALIVHRKIEPDAVHDLLKQS